MNILLVEDDPMIGLEVLEALRAEGFSAEWIRDGDTADEAARTSAFDLVILDLGLPGLDGLEVLRALRRRRQPVPVIITTARDAVEQRIRGLDAGADDYLVKPYDLDELLARIRAQLRRASGRAESVFEQSGLYINPSTREVRLQGKSVLLTAREWAVLEALLARPGIILSRIQLEERLFGWREEAGSNAVEVYIHGLRKKLGNTLIRTIRGVGYSIPKA